MTKKHFLALVPMGGQHEGKIGQHSTMQESIADAKQWAKNRFSRPVVVIEMEAGVNSLDTDTAIAEYQNGEKIQYYKI